MVTRTGIDATKFFITLLVGFIAIQAGSWILSQYTDIALLKAGWVLFLFLAVAAIVSIFMLGAKLGSLRKEDYVFIVIQFLAIIGLFIFLPNFIPEIFSSYSLELSEIINEAAGSIISPQYYLGT